MQVDRQARKRARSQRDTRWMHTCLPRARLSARRVPQTVGRSDKLGPACLLPACLSRELLHAPVRATPAVRWTTELQHACLPASGKTSYIQNNTNCSTSHPNEACLHACLPVSRLQDTLQPEELTARHLAATFPTPTVVL